MSLLIEQKRWLFLDVGSTLLNEDLYLRQRDESLYRLIRDEGIIVAPQSYWSVVASIKQGLPNSVARAILAHFVPKRSVQEMLYQRYKELLRPSAKRLRHLYPDVLEVLAALSNRIQLGIIADQEVWVAKALEDHWQIASYFEVIVLSGIVGLKKPDLQLFELGLSQAGAKAEEAIMVGDRPDKDIAPANQLGMTTVRIRRGLDFNDSPPRTQDEIADFEITALAKLPDL